MDIPDNVFSTHITSGEQADLALGLKVLRQTSVVS